MPGESQNDSFDYAPHALRLDGREWIIVIAIVLLFALLAPRLWNRAERFEPPADYRMPYALSDDYWLYRRHLEKAADDGRSVFVIGDSVIWGEYVTPHGTLSHYLNEQPGHTHRFVNAGVNGLFPLALEGLIRDFGQPLKGRKVIVHANLLWMTSPEADLSAEKEQKFNHEPLVPQFSVPIPCYRAKTDRRLSHLANRKVSLFSWSKHLQISYFDPTGIPAWTLEKGNDRRNPLAQITRKIPEEPDHDPDRGETSPRHRPWSEGGRGSQNFAWVPPGESLQWAAFQRLVRLLQSRGNEVLVVIGPLNEHMIADENRPPYQNLKREMVRWFDEQKISHLSPPLLPGDLYGDASHPLTAGYQRLAGELAGTPEFQAWSK